MTERQEALFRIIVLVVSGIILSIWKALVQILTVVHFFYVLFTNKRNKDFAEFCEYWNSQIYIFLKYMTFVNNDRPFPFSPIGKNLDKFKK
jgi:hypothetical protein